jgi:hypothetical protein
MKINKNIIAKDLDSPLQLIEIEIEDSYITGEVLVGSGSYVKGKVYKMPYINFQLVSDIHLKKDDRIVCISDLLDFTVGEIYRIHTIDNERYSFMVIDDIEENNIIDIEDFDLYFKLAKHNLKDELLLVDGLIKFNEDKIKKLKDKFETPKHYNNDNGTLYKVAQERGWNSYLFDIVKRLERSEKKGEFRTDLEKSKVVIDLWLKESEL